MDDLIQHTSQLFDDPLPSNSPPLPDAPPGEPVPTYNYGSSYTRVGSILSRPLSPRQNEDFAPRLPPRPAYSIHPSLRASNPTSPVQATMDIPPIPSSPFEERRQNEDFPPRLPARPAYSIHSSLRASNPVSPIQATMDTPPISSSPFEERTSESVNTSIEPHIFISPPPSPSALPPHTPSPVSLAATSDFSTRQRSDTSSNT